jgi:hypothetical protein
MKKLHLLFVKALLLLFLSLVFGTHHSTAQVIIIQPPRTPQVIVVPPRVIIANPRGFRNPRHFWGGRKFQRKLYRQRGWGWRRW